MRRFLLAVMVLGAASGAHAADMPEFLRGSIAPPTPTRNWEGWYAGGQVGYSSAEMDYRRTAVALTNEIFRDSVLQLPTSQMTLFGKASTQATGFGAFVGRNYQWDDLVFSLEANYNYFNNLSSSVRSSLGPLAFTAPPGTVIPPNEYHSYAVTLNGKAAVQVKDVVTFRGRAGWAYEDFLPYIFGGLAVGRMDVARQVTTDATKTVTTFSTDIFGNTTVTGVTTSSLPQVSQTFGERRTNSFVVGWTGGLGFEYMLWGNVFTRAEWEYIRFQSVKDTVVNLNSGRVGIGYRF